MYRRAYVLLIATAAVMGVWAVITALVLDRRLVDPEGSFLGPSWLRLPLILMGALLLDLLPRVVWQARLKPSRIPVVVRDRLRTHWHRERVTLVALGLVSFYVTYVCYRNLKSFLPDVVGTTYDREMHLLDRALFFGHEPGVVLHEVLGMDLTAHVLSYIYLWFIPMVPLGVCAWLVWSRNLSFGYWFVTAQCIAWALGTISYYMLPTIGPGLEYQHLYQDLADTPTKDLMYTLVDDRQRVLVGVGEAQTVAGFASLHTAITLLLAMMVQFTVRSALAKWACWINFGLTIIATIYFGWHYVADDVAGILIALVAFYLGGIASGQVFDKGGAASHPTTTTSAVPVGRG